MVVQIRQRAIAPVAPHVVLPGRRVDDVIATMYQAAIGFTFR